MNDKSDRVEQEEEQTPDVANELDDMLRSFGEEIPVSEAKEDGEESEDASEEGEEAEGKGGEEEEEASEEAAEEKDEEAEEEEEADEEVDERDKQIEDLRQKVADLESAKIEASKEEGEEEEETKDSSAQEGPFDFIGDKDVDELLMSKDALNELLNTVYSRGVENAKKTTTEEILTSIPSIVQSNVAFVQQLTAARQKFYEDNPDLEPFSKVVGAVFEEVQSNNPDKGIEDILSKTEKEVRKRLDLQKAATDTDKGKKSPRLPKKKGTRVTPDQPDIEPLEEEIGEMNKTLRR